MEGMSLKGRWGIGRSSSVGMGLSVSLELHVHSSWRGHPVWACGRLPSLSLADLQGGYGTFMALR